MKISNGTKDTWGIKWYLVYSMTPKKGQGTFSHSRDSWFSNRAFDTSFNLWLRTGRHNSLFSRRQIPNATYDICKHRKHWSRRWMKDREAIILCRTSSVSEVKWFSIEDEKNVAPHEGEPCKWFKVL